MSLFATTMAEKSVFRGMAIPTLRGLGLLLGFEQSLRLSSDGALVAMGADRDQYGPMRHVLEDREEELSLLAAWGQCQTVQEATDRLLALDGSSTGESRRRVQRWLSYLEHFGVVLREGDTLVRTPRIPGPMPANFAETLVAAYRSLCPKTIGEPAVVIDEVAREVALIYFDDGIVVTRRTFDTYLSRSLDTGALPTLHLHRPMGAEQRLFRRRADVFESMSLRRMSHD